MTYLERLNNNVNNLTKSEKLVADYIATNRDQVIYGTMNTIKDSTGVGDATIIRFCQKIGFSGFTDLKISLAKEDFSNSEKDEDNKNYYSKITNTLIDVLQKTESLIDEENLDKAINLLSTSKQVYLFGSGHSGQTARDFELVLLRVGIIARAETDPHIQSQIAAMLTEDDLIIGFSLSGRTKDLYSAMSIAQSNDAKTIIITNSPTSPLAQMADISLQTSVDEFLNGGTVAGQISQLYVCNVLMRGYELQNRVDSIQLREKSLRAIIEKRMD